jgi:hypothetical protein
MGQVLAPLLDLLRIPHRTLGVATVREDVGWAAQTFLAQRIPAALLITKGVLS